MLDYIRKRSGGLITAFIVGAIALVFVFWGVGGQNSGDNLNIYLDEEAVPIMTYLTTKREIQERARYENADAEAADLSAGRQALAFLTQRHVIKRLAAGLGLFVPDEAVIRQITSDPGFQVEGRFDRSLYETIVVNQMGLSLPAFEARVAQELLERRAVALIQSLSFTPTASLAEDFHFAEDEIAVNYAFFPARAFRGAISPTDAEIEAYFQENAETFRVPAEVRVEYVQIPFSAYLGEVEVADGELEDLYSESLAELTTPPEATVAHVLFRFPNFSPDQAAKDAVKARADAALATMTAENFASVGAALQDDPEAAAIYEDLGLIRRDDLVAEFAAAAFDEGPQRLNEILGPVETLFGYHLIQVSAYNPGGPQSFAEAEPALVETLKTRKARRLAIDRLENILSQAQYGETSVDLKALAEGQGLTSEVSEFFNVDNPPAFLAGRQGEAASALAWPIGQLSEPLDEDGFFAVYVPLERKESFIPSLSDPDVSARARDLLIDATALAQSRAAAQSYVAAASERGWTLGQANLTPGTFEAGQTPFTARLNIFNIPGTPLSQADSLELIGAILGLQKAGDVAPEPIAVLSPDSPGYLVTSLSNFRPAPEENFADNLDARRAAALGEGQLAVLSHWLSSRSGQVMMKIPPELTAELGFE
ncbi:MAG: SurA N-terminal domain-containing protein [Deltaproteobacteria bacterium]|jgi:peptidyl-prolyl cis-trans isomerase D|nr:SurA N-terminal domain-containing protein [Deltaproteobacteria bacterium]